MNDLPELIFQVIIFFANVSKHVSIKFKFQDPGSILTTSFYCSKLSYEQIVYRISLNLCYFVNEY